MDFQKVTIGVNSDTINAYLQKIRADVIDSAKSKLSSSQEELFNTFKANWQGVSRDNFIANMEAATTSVQNSLEEHYNTLQAKVYAIHNAWIQQDEEMVTLNGGTN